MTLKTLFSMTAVLLGVGWLFFPATMLTWWNASTDEITVQMSRRCATIGPRAWGAVVVEALLVAPV